MLDKMKQLWEMKQQADRIKRELDAVTVECTEVPGVKVKVSGAQKFHSIEVDERYFTEGNKGKLEQDLLNSMNAAIRKSQEVAAKKMKDVLPGFPQM